MPVIAKRALAVLGAAALAVAVFAAGAHAGQHHARADSGTTNMYHHG